MATAYSRRVTPSDTAPTARRRSIHVAAALLPLLLPACSDTPPGSTDAEPELTAWAPVFETRIGSADDPEQSLTRIGQVLIGPGGRLYVSQSSDREIRMYDAGGDLLGTIGREGEGPGEFRGISWMSLRNDTLYTSDNGLGRLTAFDLEGGLLGSVQWSSEMQSGGEGYGFGPGTPQVLLDDGTALLRPPMFVAGRRAQPGITRSSRTVPYFRMDRQGSFIDTLAPVTSEFTSVRVEVEGTVVAVPCLTDDNPLAALSPDGRGVVTVDRRVVPGPEPATIGVALVSPAGDTAYAQSVPYQPIPLPDEVLQNHIEGYREARLSAERPAPSAAQVESVLREAECLPATHVPVTELAVTQDGWIWLRREAELGDSVTWNVLDPDGHPAAELRLPAGQSVAAAGGDLLIATEEDELDIPYVVVYRLPR